MTSRTVRNFFLEYEKARQVFLSVPKLILMSLQNNLLKRFHVYLFLILFLIISTTNSDGTVQTFKFSKFFKIKKWRR